MSRDDLHRLIDALPDDELELARQLLEQVQEGDLHEGHDHDHDHGDEDGEEEDIDAAVEWHFHFDLTHPDGSEIDSEKADDLMAHIAAWADERGLEISGEVLAVVDEEEGEEAGPA